MYAMSASRAGHITLDPIKRLLDIATSHSTSAAGNSTTVGRQPGFTGSKSASSTPTRVMSPQPPSSPKPTKTRAAPSSRAASSLSTSTTTQHKAPPQPEQQPFRHTMKAPASFLTASLHESAVPIAGSRSRGVRSASREEREGNNHNNINTDTHSDSNSPNYQHSEPLFTRRPSSASSRSSQQGTRQSRDRRSAGSDRESNASVSDATLAGDVRSSSTAKGDPRPTLGMLVVAPMFRNQPQPQPARDAKPPRPLPALVHNPLSTAARHASRGVHRGSSLTDLVSAMHIRAPPDGSAQHQPASLRNIGKSASIKALLLSCDDLMVPQATPNYAAAAVVVQESVTALPSTRRRAATTSTVPSSASKAVTLEPVLHVGHARTSPRPVSPGAHASRMDAQHSSRSSGQRGAGEDTRAQRSQSEVKDAYV